MTLWLVWMDVGTIVSFVRDPDIGLFFTPSEPEPFSGVFKTLQSSRLAMQVIPYTREDIRRLRTIAVDVMNHGGEDRILKLGRCFTRTSRCGGRLNRRQRLPRAGVARRQ